MLLSRDSSSSSYFIWPATNETHLTLALYKSTKDKVEVRLKFRECRHRTLVSLNESWSNVGESETRWLAEILSSTSIEVSSTRNQPSPSNASLSPTCQPDVVIAQLHASIGLLSRPDDHLFVEHRCVVSTTSGSTRSTSKWLAIVVF